MQKVLICTTYDSGMRSPIDGWSSEDGNAVVDASRKHPTSNIMGDPKQVGFIGSYPIQYPVTPLHAIGLGWKLLAPPTSTKVEDLNGNYLREEWEWWFVKD